MVKWSDTWYEKREQSGLKFEKWVEKKSSAYALCRLCNRELKSARYVSLETTLREAKACRSVKTYDF